MDETDRNGNGTITEETPFTDERETDQDRGTEGTEPANTSLQTHQGADQTRTPQEPPVNDQNKCQRIKQWCNRYKLWIIIALLCIFIVILVVFKEQHYLQRPQPQHAYFQLKTRGYRELNAKTILQWVEEEDQNDGNIILVNGSYILIPQDNRYTIDASVQLYIPINTSTLHIILTLEGNNGKILRHIKHSTRTSDTAKHLPIPLSIKQKFKAQDLICLKMNKAEFISRDRHSSYLSISNLA